MNKATLTSWFKTYKKIIVKIILIIFLSNLPPVYGLIRTFADWQSFRYSTYNGSVTFISFWDRNFEMMQRVHKGCLVARPNLKDKNMYRLFAKNPLAFWRWRAYFFDKEYKLPYKSWDEIKKTREAENIKGVTGCTRDF